MKLYAYCFTEDGDAPSEFLTGIGGSQVRVLKAEGFSILVSDFPTETVPINRHNVLAHSAVIQRVLAHTTPLPLRFGTLIAEEQLRNYACAKREALHEKFDSLRGCIEMNVKLISQAAQAVVRQHLPQPADKPGTAFLVQKRREILGSETRIAEAKRLAAWLEEHIGDLIKEASIEQSRTDKLILAASHLLERGVVEQYRARLKTARAERPELHFLVSGPWAPYSFANIELEFKSQFGVS